MPAGAKRLTLHLTAAQRQRYERAAARCGLTLTSWLVAAAELAVGVQLHQDRNEVRGGRDPVR